MTLLTVAIAMENQSADKAFFVSENAVSGSCLSFISQYNCLVTKLLQKHNKCSLDRKLHHSAYFVIGPYAETTANGQETKCPKSLKSPIKEHGNIQNMLM